MGHAGQPGALVARADAEERVIGDIGDVVVLEQDDLQAVVQLVDGDVLGAEPGRERAGSAAGSRIKAGSSASWNLLAVPLFCRPAGSGKRKSIVSYAVGAVLGF